MSSGGSLEQVGEARLNGPGTAIVGQPMVFIRDAVGHLGVGSFKRKVEVLISPTNLEGGIDFPTQGSGVGLIVRPNHRSVRTVRKSQKVGGDDSHSGSW